jgi:spore coat polysaccharide biosynthesis protein SpsF
MVTSAVPHGRRRTIAVLQARTSSSRLPGKVLCELAGKPMIVRQIERIRRARLLDGLVVATSADASDDELARVIVAEGIAVFRGSLDDVLGRFVGALAQYPAEHVVRLTGDCPLADPDVIDGVIAHHLAGAADISGNQNQPTFPDGLDVEIVRADCLREAATEATLKLEREHATQFFYRRPERFRIAHYKTHPDLSALRWTVDEPQDLAFVRAVYDALLPSKADFGWRDVLELLHEQPDLSTINAGFARNEGLARSLRTEFATQVGEH